MRKAVRLVMCAVDRPVLSISKRQQVIGTQGDIRRTAVVASHRQIHPANTTTAGEGGRIGVNLSSIVGPDDAITPTYGPEGSSPDFRRLRSVASGAGREPSGRFRPEAPESYRTPGSNQIIS